MRTKALINHFHDLQPIYSAHFEPGAKGRLATAGGDNNVRVIPQLAYFCTFLHQARLELLANVIDLANP